MKEKIKNEESTEELDELEKHNMSFNLNQTNELFDDNEALKKNPIINVKRIALPKNGENWEIFEEDKKIFTINGVKLTKRERNILRTADGIKIIIEEYKLGNKSLAKIKIKLKEFWKKNND